MLIVFLLLVWFLCGVVALAFERKASGNAGGVSILPVFPLVPIRAWGVAYLIDLAIDPYGTYAIAALHGVLLVAVVGAILRFRGIIRRRQDFYKESG